MSHTSRLPTSSATSPGASRSGRIMRATNGTSFRRQPRGSLRLGQKQPPCGRRGTKARSRPSWTRSSTTSASTATEGRWLNTRLMRWLFGMRTKGQRPGEPGTRSGHHLGDLKCHHKAVTSPEMEESSPSGVSSEQGDSRPFRAIENHPVSCTGKGGRRFCTV